MKALENSCPGSRAELRGSLASGQVDRYSDIDLRWIVSDDAFARAVAAVASPLRSVGPLDSLRLDPRFRRSRKRRLIFVRYADVSLFWRIDLDVFAASVAGDVTTTSIS
jgi:hypothetical protein